MAQRRAERQALIFAPHQLAAAAHRSIFPHDSYGHFALNHAIRGVHS
jgi:hypothetical protein